MNDINLTSVVARLGSNPFQKIINETVIVEPSAKLLHHLNEAGSDIWSFLDRPRTVAAIISQLAEMYQVDPATLEADTRRFLREMQERHLIAIN